MGEQNKEHLDNQLRQLPEIDPPNTLWKDIERQLDFQDRISDKIAELPEVSPEDNIWAKIEESLLTNNKPAAKHIRLKTVIGYSASIAASIILFIVFLKPSNENQSVKLSYSIEPEQTIFNTFIDADSESDALEFINYTCSLQLQICETEEFKGLKTQLDDLTIEFENINQQLASNEDNPYLMKAQIQVENMRADITKRLIKIITS